MPKGRSQRRLKAASNLISSFTHKGGKNKDAYKNHSSHPLGRTGFSDLLERDDLTMRRNSDHDAELTETLQANSKDGMCPSTAEVAKMLRHAASGSFTDEEGEGEDANNGDTSPLGSHLRKYSSGVSTGTGSEYGDSDYGDDSCTNELDDQFEVKKGGYRTNSWALLESLGDNPSSKELANVAAVRAKEYIEECLSADFSVLNREVWESMPQYSKADLVVGQHLGKGSFSDAFEVICTVEDEEEAKKPARTWQEDGAELDQMIRAKFQPAKRMPSIIAEVNDGDEPDRSKAESDLDKEIEDVFGGKIDVSENSKESSMGDDFDTFLKSQGMGASDREGEDLDKEIDALFGGPQPKSKSALQSDPDEAIDHDGSKEKKEEDDLDNEIEAMFGKPKRKEEEEDDLDNEIEAMFGKPKRKEEKEDDLDKEIEAMFGKPKRKEEKEDDLDQEIEAMFGKPKGANGKSDKYFRASSGPLAEDGFQPSALRRPNRNRRATMDLGDGRLNLGASVCMGTQARQPKQKQTRKVVMAMKCLRPQIRSNSEQFMIGVEDLVHETAMLASLDHPNIVKLHGRAVGCLSNSFRLSDGYFILLDRLKDTLEDRIGRWKKNTSKGAPPGLTQIKSAKCIADALAHLHSKRIVFRDLKPANVGFDSTGVLKLFDFGFAVGVDEPRRGSSICSDEDEEESHLLYDKCGTPRYMAPEVGLMTGYDMAADVYSFGILLWEMCALKKPFGKVKSAAEFDKTVFEKGARPKVNKRWPVDIQELMTLCWSSYPADRPEMSVVKSLLAGHERYLSQQRRNGNGRGSSLRNSLTFRRFTQ